MSKRTKVGNPKLAIATIRVSTKEQELGPKAQMRSIEAWATREGITLLAVYIDQGVSGAAPLGDRKGLLGALVALEELGAGVLVASKRDRLARDLRMVSIIESETKKAGATIRTADGASDGKGSLGMMEKGFQDLFSAYEREVIKERTKAALAVKKARGERVGCIAYGWQLAPDGIHLVRNESEQSIITVVHQARAKGLSLMAISRELDSLGLTSRAGKCFAKPQIARMLTA